MQWSEAQGNGGGYSVPMKSDGTFTIVMMKRWLLIVVIGCLPALGQAPDGVLSGQIRQPDGNPVASVRVSLIGALTYSRTDVGFAPLSREKNHPANANCRINFYG